jgi:predicted RNA-binding Zn-ribbon protein involved in translation (DUF1610 family)
MMTPETAPCPICQTPGPSGLDILSNSSSVDCPRCGEFRIGRIWVTRLQNPELMFSPRQAANASGYLRENLGFALMTKADIEFLRSRPTPGITQRATKLLRYLAQRLPEVGTLFHIPRNKLEQERLPDNSFLRMDELIGHTWAIDSKEVNFLVNNVLVPKYFDEHQITPLGWQALESEATDEDPSLAFVAMSFKQELKPVFTHAIDPAIRAAGYNPERMDFVEHMDSITDKMMADIRRAKFLVVDLTEHRPNVYFEAGFAFGLGKRVIFLVQEDQKDDVHFDIQQYSYIPWKMDNLEDLKNRLTQRILGPLGQGPIPV